MSDARASCASYRSYANGKHLMKRKRGASAYARAQTPVHELLQLLGFQNM